MLAAIDWRNLMLLSLFGQLCILSPQLRAQESEPRGGIEPYRIFYYYSFLTLDRCGDGQAGALWRKATLEKLDHCPLSPEKRRAFRSEIAEIQAGATHKIESDKTEHGENCPASFKNAPQYAELLSELDLYSKGEISVDALTWKSCDYDGAYP
jgi:hypothetical protein